MNLEKRKVLEMVRDGVISVEEGDQLLAILEENQKDEKKSRKIKAKIKAELERAKEDILKAKEKVKEEYEKIDFGKVKTSIKKGIKKVDIAVKKVDDAILKYGEKMFNKNGGVDVEVEVEEIDPLKDENASFFDENKKQE